MSRGQSVERDLATMLFQSASTDYLRERLKNIIGEEDFYETMRNYARDLETTKNNFELAWQELSKEL